MIKLATLNYKIMKKHKINFIIISKVDKFIQYKKPLVILTTSGFNVEGINYFPCTRQRTFFYQQVRMALFL